MKLSFKFKFRILHFLGAVFLTGDDCGNCNIHTPARPMLTPALIWV